MSRRTRAGLWTMAVAMVALPSLDPTCALDAQTTPVRTTWTGYAQNVGAWSDDSPLSRSGASDFTRLRGMLSATRGALRFEAAYEHTFLVRDEDTGGATTAVSTASGNWLDLEWDIEDRSGTHWRHRFDRLALSWEGAAVELTVGRQVVSWASTLIFTPADPFTPFDPADPFREYRAGVDALRARWFPGAFSEIEVVVRPTEVLGEDQTTALLRGKTNQGGWDFGAWGGVLYDRAAVAGFVVGELAGWALRTEASVRFEEDETGFRGALGLDRRFSVRSRDLFVGIEYQRDDFGATEGEIFQLPETDPLMRGELQTLSRDALAVRASLQLHPLWAVDALALWSLNDGSVLWAPGLGWSATSSLSVRAGVYVGTGEPAPNTILISALTEYGELPTSAYVAASLFF